MVSFEVDSVSNQFADEKIEDCLRHDDDDDDDEKSQAKQNFDSQTQRSQVPGSQCPIHISLSSPSLL